MCSTYCLFYLLLFIFVYFCFLKIHEFRQNKTCPLPQKPVNNFLHTVHVVPRCRSSNPCLPQQQDTIPYAVQNLSLALLKMGKICPKHVELILEINKLLLLYLVGFLYYFAYTDIIVRESINTKFPPTPYTPILTIFLHTYWYINLKSTISCVS
jgi:hypothetical protein